MVSTFLHSWKAMVYDSFSFVLRNTPFNKEELSSILKFGAEELFKDHDQEADQKLQVKFQLM